MLARLGLQRHGGLRLVTQTLLNPFHLLILAPQRVKTVKAGQQPKLSWEQRGDSEPIRLIRFRFPTG